MGVRFNVAAYRAEIDILYQQGKLTAADKLSDEKKERVACRGPWLRARFLREADIVVPSTGNRYYLRRPLKKRD